MIDEQEEKDLSISPNPAYGSSVNVRVTSGQMRTISWRITDQYGVVSKSGKTQVNRGINRLRIPIEQLDSGLYTFTDESGNAARFVRIR